MVSPLQVEQITSQVAGALSAGAPNADSRARERSLGYSAMLYAVQSRCECDACLLLREASDLMRVAPKRQEPSRGPDLNPPA
jgi:hypothetical protein